MCCEMSDPSLIAPLSSTLLAVVFGMSRATLTSTLDVPNEQEALDEQQKATIVCVELSDGVRGRQVM